GGREGADEERECKHQRARDPLTPHPALSPFRGEGFVVRPLKSNRSSPPEGERPGEGEWRITDFAAATPAAPRPASARAPCGSAGAGPARACAAAGSW